MEDDAPAAVPEWVVTYGDMMSLLLTFFIMLVSLSEVVAEEKYRAILDALQQYTGYRAGPPSPPGQSFPLNSLESQLETLGSFADEDLGRGGIKIRSVAGEHMRVFQVREGRPVQVGEPLVFQHGEESLPGATRPKLAQIAADLAGKPNKIEIRGHASTPDRSPAAPEDDPLTLSYERARGIVSALVTRGIDPERIRITAMADLDPPPETGDRHSWLPDRVEVYMLDAFASDYVGPREAP